MSEIEQAIRRAARATGGDVAAMIEAGVKAGIEQAMRWPERAPDKSHYGARCTDTSCPDAAIENHSHIDPATQTALVTDAVRSTYGATPSDEETHALDHWNRGVVRPGCRYCEGAVAGQDDMMTRPEGADQ